MKIISMGWKCSTHGSGAGKAVPLHVINAYVGAEVQLHSFLSSVFDGSDFSVSCPGCCTRSERTDLRYPFNGRLGGIWNRGKYFASAWDMPRGGLLVKPLKGKYCSE